MFEQYPEVGKELRLWRSNFGKKGYFARTVGDELTAEAIRKYRVS